MRNSDAVVDAAGVMGENSKAPGDSRRVGTPRRFALVRVADRVRGAWESVFVRVKRDWPPPYVGGYKEGEPARLRYAEPRLRQSFLEAEEGGA